MSSGTTSQDGNWKAKETAEENQYIRQKEREQLAAIRNQVSTADQSDKKDNGATRDRDFEGGYGGQEDLEDRYATTCGEH